MSDSSIKVNKFLKLPESYLNSLPTKVLWQLPFIVYGNFLFTLCFIFLGTMIVWQGEAWKSVGYLSFVTSVLFVASYIFIRKQKINVAVYMSSLGVLFAVFLIVVLCPSAVTSFMYYRSGCFIAVMMVCHQVISLSKKQTTLFLLGCLLIWTVGIVTSFSANLANDMPGTISAIIINTIAIFVVYAVTKLMDKFNEKIILSAEDAEKSAKTSLSSITKVIEESKNGLEVGERLHKGAQKASGDINEVQGLYAGIVKNAMGLTENSVEISDSSEAVKNHAEQMKASVEKQNAYIGETSEALNSISGNLSNLNTIAEQRSSNMKKMMETLDSEKNLIRKIVEEVKLVQESSDGIAGFVKTVDSIAEQTGLLAMNASIEAAHAGERGKGFSVIAQEIRKLSEQTTRNAKQISEELGKNAEVVLSTTQSVASFEQYIQKTTEEMRSTIEMIEQLLTGIKDIDDETGRVMSSLKFVVDQSKETEEVVDSVVDEIDNQNNTITSIKAFASELSEKIGQMKNRLTDIQSVVSDVESESSLNIEVSKKITDSLNS